MTHFWEISKICFIYHNILRNFATFRERKTDLTGTGRYDVHWINLAQDWDKWRAVFNTAMNFLVPWKVWNFLTSWRTADLPTRAFSMQLLSVTICWQRWAIYIHTYIHTRETRWRSSIPDGVTGIFHWHNPSGRTMALGSIQPLTEMSTRNISLGGKGARCVGLTTLPPSGADCLEIWDPQPSGTLRACPGL